MKNKKPNRDRTNKGEKVYHIQSKKNIDNWNSDSNYHNRKINSLKNDLGKWLLQSPEPLTY